LVQAGQCQNDHPAKGRNDPQQGVQQINDKKENRHPGQIQQGHRPGPGHKLPPTGQIVKRLVCHQFAVAMHRSLKHRPSKAAIQHHAEAHQYTLAHQIKQRKEAYKHKGKGG